MYEKTWTNPHPGCLIILIDLSASMGDYPLRGHGSRSPYQKYRIIIDALEDFLRNLCMRYIPDAPYGASADVAILGYQDTTVRTLFRNSLFNKEFVSGRDLLEDPFLRHISISKEVNGRDFVTTERATVSWLSALPRGTRPMRAAFRRAQDLAEKWAKYNPKSYPPIILNFTDGQSTDGDILPVVEEIMAIGTADGNALVFNTHIDSKNDRQVRFPVRMPGLSGDPYAASLYRGSSDLPEAMCQEVARDLGSTIVAGRRAMIFNGKESAVDLVLDCVDSRWPFLPALGDSVFGMPSRLATGVEKTDPLRVFLCYSSGDKEQIRTLYQRLRDSYVGPWFDEEELLPGQDWATEIRKVMRGIDVVLVCVSASSVSRAGFVQKEIKYALDRADEQPDGTIFVIPVRLEKCELPERLRHLHRVDIYERDGYQKLIRALQARAASLGRDEPSLW